MRPVRIIMTTLASAVLWLAPAGSALAHEGWFVEEGQHAGEFFPADWIIFLTSLTVAFFVSSAAALDRHPVSRRLQGLLEKAQGVLPVGIEWRVVALLSGAMLIANSFMGVFLAPNLVLPTPELVTIGAVAQALTGIFLVTQLSFVLPALAILGVALPLAAVHFAPSQLLDYAVEFAALAAALFFFGIRTSALDDRLCKRLGYCRNHSPHLPVTLIRVGLGLTIVILALHHKLLSPDLALTFLDKYDLNFMRGTGFVEFSNVHFVYAAGLMEIAIGAMLISGIATRLAAGMLTTFLLGTMVLLGPAELIGHLPILAIALLLIYRGSGDYRLATGKG